ncbi:hypothetical protein EC915_11613 [Pseudomonas sp. LP_7_YM]|nr:hypothetical protein EC915_11613 [Pseudomonas sp. LP_7_YM]
MGLREYGMRGCDTDVLQQSDCPTAAALEPATAGKPDCYREMEGIPRT